MKTSILIVVCALAALIVAGCGLTANTNRSGSGTTAASAVSSAVNKLSGRTFTFQSLPQNLTELKARPEANLKDPYGVAALVVAALNRYEASQSDCIEMLNFLKGPEPLSAYEKQFIRERFEGNKYYKARSFFKGATPENNYKPSTPYTITVEPNPYSFQTDGWCTLWLKSGGADSLRPIKLRKKASTGEWFLNEIQFLSDIRVPASQDAWH